MREILLDGVAEIANYLAIKYGVRRSEKTIRKWIREGDDRLPVFLGPTGRGVLCAPEQLDAWWASRTRAPIREQLPDLP